MGTARHLDLSPERLDALARLLRAEGLTRPAAAPVPRRPDPDAPAPLSFPQRRLWFLDQLDPGSTAYTIPNAVRILGPLDTGLFARACDLVVRRHESLRTIFTTVDGQPRQRVVSEAADERLGERQQPAHHHDSVHQRRTVHHGLRADHQRRRRAPGHRRHEAGAGDRRRRRLDRSPALTARVRPLSRMAVWTFPSRRLATLAVAT